MDSRVATGYVLAVSVILIYIYIYIRNTPPWCGLLWRPGAGQGFEPPPASARPCALPPGHCPLLRVILISLSYFFVMSGDFSILLVSQCIS
jgi:hypothetical protein